MDQILYYLLTTHDALLPEDYAAVRAMLHTLYGIPCEDEDTPEETNEE